MSSATGPGKGGATGGRALPARRRSTTAHPARLPAGRLLPEKTASRLPERGWAAPVAPLADETAAAVQRQAALGHAFGRLTVQPWTLGPLQPEPVNGTPLHEPIQCVGGRKFGLRVTGDNKDETVAEGLENLRKVRQAYKTDVKKAKEAAAETFRESGKMDDLGTQQEYTRALEAAELTPEGLFSRLTGGLTRDGDVISYKGVEIAELLRGAAAYQQTQAAGQGTAAIFKRHTLEGLSAAEYVDVRGAKVRRYAYRGITPPERKAYKEGKPLRPENRGRKTAGLMGYNYDPKTGAPTERVRDPMEGKVRDLEWLNEKSGTNLEAVPDDPRLLAFLQTRKGVGKLLSATSTGKEITSNKGKEFTGFGRIKIDLAKVPEADVLHHYKSALFSATMLNRLVGRRNRGPSERLQWETARANETVLRNRELVLSQIPHAAVAGLEDTPARKAYEQEFRKLYVAKYKEAYADELSEAGLNEPAPDPASVPYVEDHYTQVQARADFKPSVAVSAARADAQSRVDFAESYRESYERGWKLGYEDAAWESTYVAQHAEDVSAIDVPDAPKPANVPAGTGANAGTTQGFTDGKAAGMVAGANYSG